MKKSLKVFVSLLLVMALCFSFLAPAYADAYETYDDSYSEEVTDSNTTDNAFEETPGYDVFSRAPLRGALLHAVKQPKSKCL